MTGFLAEHNLPVAVADHIRALLKYIFLIPKLQVHMHVVVPVKINVCLKRAIKPDLQAKMTDQMRDRHSVSTDGSNDQNLEKINPVTVRLFDIKQHKVVTNP